MSERAWESARLVPPPEAVRVAAVVGLVYYLGACLGLALTSEPMPLAILWPPNALLLAALLLLPARRWRDALIGAFAGHLLAQVPAGVPLAMVLGWFVSNSFEALLGALLVGWLARRRIALLALPETLALLFAAAVACVLSSFVDAAFVRLAGFSDTGYWLLWRTRIPSNLLAVLVFVPVVLSWSRWHGMSRARLAEAALMFTALLVVSLATFNTPLVQASVDPSSFELLYLPLPFLLWAALRFGPALASAGFAAMAFLVIWGVRHGQGPFWNAAQLQDALPVQLFLLAIGIPLLLLATAREQLLAERRGAEVQAREQRAQLTHLTRVASLSDYSASLAHELNQPLTAILSNAQAAQRFLAREPLNIAEIRSILDEITEADKRAGELIHHLRLLMKKSDEAFARVDLNQLVLQVLHFANGELVLHGVQAVTSLAPELPAVRGDRVQLQQLLLNLVSNAADAMDGQLRPRRLAITTLAARDGRVQLIVADTGPGIAADQRERVFEPFVTGKSHGLGMGLAICRTIAGAHGGALHAENGEEGARLRLTLPAA